MAKLYAQFCGNNHKCDAVSAVVKYVFIPDTTSRESGIGSAKLTIEITHANVQEYDEKDVTKIEEGMLYFNEQDIDNLVVQGPVLTYSSDDMSTNFLHFKVQVNGIKVQHAKFIENLNNH